MQYGVLTGWMLSVLLLSLRVAPAFALAPPFTLTRVPASFRMLLGVGISACVVGWQPAATSVADLRVEDLALVAGRELFLGAIAVMALNLMFGALYVAGRTIDVQAGFGLALLIDPSTRNQVPLAGALLAYGAGLVFFAMDGHIELLRILAASLETIPLGAAAPAPSLARLTAFISTVFVAAFGIAGGTILCLFLTDLAIALLSRTAPQLNVLVLGFQVKTLLLFVALPTSFGLAGALFARLVRITLEAIPRLL
ncbi:MAG TPA: flagellar biosynthetic protein FliR [Phenylobacterium sp.]